MTGSAGGHDALHTYSRCYEGLRSFCGPGLATQPEIALRCVEAAALYASSHHPGRFADGTIENLAVSVGRDLERSAPRGSGGAVAPRRPSGREQGARRRILHVSPVVWRVGGHTRTLQNWIRLDRESQHSVVLTQKLDPTLRAELDTSVRNTGGEIAVLSADGLLGKAAQLRSMARSSADLVILHHSCNDVVPIAAFATDDLPPVAFVNDCDQAFWLGCSITDVVVNQRAAGARLSVDRRFTSNNAVLPIPLRADPPRLTREDARCTLGIPPDHVALLTVGRAIKYKPTQSHGFFRTVRKALDRNPRAHLYVVGLSAEQAVKWRLDSSHPRIHLCGSIPDPSLYRAAADIYLESMPFGSATALLEAALAGLPAVLPFAPPHELFVTNHGLESVVTNPQTEAEYLDRVHSLLDNARDRARLGEALQTYVASHHTGDGWRQQVAEFYPIADRLEHRAGPIPATECGTSELDGALSEWHAFLNADDEATMREPGAARDLVIQTARHAKTLGDYRGALRILQRYNLTFGFDRSVLRAAGELFAHRLYSW